MSYERFQEKVNALIKRAGGNIKVWFSTDEEKGKHTARCSDGTTIIGNSTVLKLTVRWGSGHQSMVAV